MVGQSVVLILIHIYICNIYNIGIPIVCFCTPPKHISKHSPQHILNTSCTNIGRNSIHDSRVIHHYTNDHNTLNTLNYTTNTTNTTNTTSTNTKTSNNNTTTTTTAS